MTVERERNAAQRLYFVNAWVDYAFIGGLSIALYVAMSRWSDGERTATIWQTSAALAWVVNWPHFSATNYRLYHSRQNVRQYPLTAFAIPAVLLLFMLAAFLSPIRVAPALVKLFLIWSPYHFSGQTLGISLIYARRAGFTVGKWERIALSGFIFGTFLVQTAYAETGLTPSSYYSVTTAPLGIPLWVPGLIRAMMVASGLVFCILLGRWSLRKKRLPPPIVVLPAATQFTWFVLGSKVPNFNEFIPFFHSLQYLLIAWAMHLKEKLDMQQSAPSPVFVWRETARWGTINVAGGAMLFFGLPAIGAAAGFEASFATAVVLAIVQIHHFFVDGVIWKLKNPKVSSSLPINLGQILVSEPAPSGQVASV